MTSSFQTTLIHCREDVESMFAEKDRDNDGLLSFEEFTGQETKVEKAFKAMDKDGDGYVTKAEFAKVCKNLTKEQVTILSTQISNEKLRYAFTDDLKMLFR